MLRFWRRYLISSAGTSTIELALLFPVFLLMTLGVIEFGRAMWIQSALQYAVQLAARCGAVDTSTCASAAQTVSFAVTQSQPLTIPSSDFSASTQNCGSSVSVNYPFTFVVPQLFPFNISLTAQACYPKAS